jgi:6,7-dimethyl-8-ribityllumazine synthase
MSLAAPKASTLSGATFTVGIAASRYNERLVDALLRQVCAGLRAAGVQEKCLTIIRVPGANELPSAVQLLAQRARFDVFVALGVLIRGETIHYELIAESASHALQRVALDTRTPVINGVIAVETAAQAAARCGGRIDRGAEFARAALEMADLKRRLRKP